ncbi:putative holin-like toxin [Bacillus swezeyi]|uniref:putative holin-like toxin n=1 Tax=Bacillus swezeyi TaxID=1925020 RepID=UPI00399CA6D9
MIEVATAIQLMLMFGTLIVAILTLAYSLRLRLQPLTININFPYHSSPENDLKAHRAPVLSRDSVY